MVNQAAHRQSHCRSPSATRDLHRLSNGGFWAEVRRGRARVIISSSAMCRAASSLAISGMTAGSHHSAARPITATAIRSITGRQLSTQDFFRRVVRWDNDNSMTVIADCTDASSSTALIRWRKLETAPVPAIPIHNKVHRVG